MKSARFLLVMVLMLSLAAPAMAAVELGGKVGSTFELKRDVNDEWVLEGKTGIELETSIESEGRRPIKAVVQLTPWALDGSFVDGEPVFDFHQRPGQDDLEIGAHKAWIETEGSFWDRGPIVSTRIGDVNVAWDDYVAHLGDRPGVTVDGLQVGPVAARAFYTWDNAANVRPMGVAASASVEGVDVDGVLVLADGKTNMAMGAGTSLIPGLWVGGRVALDEGQNHLYRVEASTEVIDGITIGASYRGAHDDFDPMYTDAGEYDMLTGFNVGVETVQSGIELAAEYDEPTKEAKLSARRGMVISGFDLAGEYNATIRSGADAEHALKATAKTDMIPYLMGLGLEGQVKLVGGDVSWNAGADYLAPNGIELGAGYDSEDGPMASAGVTVNF